MTPPSPTTTTPKFSSAEEEAKKAQEKAARAEALAEAMLSTLEREVAPKYMDEQISACVHKSSAEVYASVTKQSRETAQTLEAWGQRMEMQEKAVKEALQTVREEFTGLVEEAEERATRNAKAHNDELLPDHLKTMQASVDQLRDDNKTLREELKSVQATFELLRDDNKTLRNKLALLQAQHLSNAADDEGEAGASPSAAPIA